MTAALDSFFLSRVARAGGFSGPFSLKYIVRPLRIAHVRET